MATDEQQQNADAVASKVATLAALYATGVLTRQAFVDAFALLVYAAKVRASHLAEVALWRWSLTRWPDPIEPQGIVPDPEEIDVLRDAVETIADGPDEKARTVERVERVATDAALEAGRDSAQDRMERAGVTHWKWVAQPDSCDDCQRRNGNVYRIDVRFRDHPRCTCSLEPATPEEIEISKRKRAALKRRKERTNQ